ncbi:response regulator transcription factor [Saprospiraceae bacterium]|nr:response regulator transcription factor [Saprospiraceae bacterium]
MKALILEDNISYSWEYEMILDKLGVSVSGVYKSWKEIISQVRKDPPDFMIVDLFLENNEKGLDFIKDIKGMYIPIIVCTGYPEPDFMNQALEYGVTAFFSKPLDKPALTYEVQKIIHQLNSKEFEKNHLFLKDKKVRTKVPFSDIYKIEIDGNYSYIYSILGKKFILKISLNKLLSRLDKDLFIRCHRSTVVNYNYIKELDSINSKLILSSGEEVLIGSKYKPEIRKLITT